MSKEKEWIDSLKEHVRPTEETLVDFSLSEPPAASGNFQRTPQQGLLSTFSSLSSAKQKKFKVEVARENRPPPPAPKRVEPITPPVKENIKSINFHHGVKKPFHVEFCFGTDEKFEGFRDPNTPFCIPSFKLSRPEFFRGEIDKEPHPNEVHSFPAQIYRVSKDEATNKESYVDIGTGSVSLQHSDGSYILELNVDFAHPSLRLIKGVQPRIKQDCFVQIFVEQLPAKEPSIYLIRCSSATDAQEFCKIVSDCVALF